MLKASYDNERNLVIVEFQGKVDAAQAEPFYREVQKVVPKTGGFRLLTDFTKLENMDIEVQDSIKKTMDFFNLQGVMEIYRVIPNPDKDFGFNIMSIFHYSKAVKTVTVQSRGEAEERLKGPAAHRLGARNAVIFITGANRGIGRALVETALELGAKKIYAGARKPETLKELAEKNLGRVVAVKLDITSEEQVQAAAKLAQDVTLLINNAGTASMGGFTANYNAEGAKSEMNTNYFGTLSMARAFAPVLKNNGGGTIVNIVSVAGLRSFPMAGAYSASKAAEHSLTQGLRNELMEQKTFVAGVYPGPVDTDMARGFEFEKESPRQVALNVYKGLEEGSEDIFPDKYSVEFGLSLKSPAAYAQANT